MGPKNGKQPKDSAPNPNSVVNRETFQRLNFLYQASAYLKRIETSAHGPMGVDRSRSQKKGGKRRQATLGELGSSYVQCMRTIGNRSVIRIDPNVKRTLCKGCDTILLPGTTASVRIKSSTDKGREVVYTCIGCHARRIIPASSSGPSGPSPTPVPSLSSANSITPASSLQTAVKELETPIVGPSSQPHIPAPQTVRPKRIPRPLPLFARTDAGHVVFRGNEVLHQEQ